MATTEKTGKNKIVENSAAIIGVNPQGGTSVYTY